MQLIAIGAAIDYRLVARDGAAVIEFSWSGFDEMAASAAGRGTDASGQNDEGCPPRPRLNRSVSLDPSEIDACFWHSQREGGNLQSLPITIRGRTKSTNRPHSPSQSALNGSRSLTDQD
jgi:hypothetical protein